MCVIRKETGIYMKNAGSGRHFVGISAGHTAAAGIFSAKKPYHSRTCGLRDCDGGKKKSGSLITADYAMEQGKEVYALPGRVTDALSEGTNHLIQQGAGIFVSVEDFLQELQLQPQNITTQIDFRKIFLKRRIVGVCFIRFLSGGSWNPDRKSPYGLVEILPVLERLEQKGFIQETIPNYYIKTI